MKIRMSADLALPLDAATETFAILGRRGSGKTHTAIVMAEEMLRAGVQVVVLDPLDVWWGLRVSQDGKAPGLAIYVAGGSHADVPLTGDAGRVLADAVVDRGLSIVLSLRHLSKADQRRFVGDFCERLYDRKADPTHRTALHVFIDEADAFVPQRLQPGAERCFGAVDTLVRRGRSSGLAPTLISQRPQVINKDVLSQTEVLVSHQLTGPQDRKALEAWIDANDTDNQRATFMASLASLPKGTAWFWSPGLLGIFKRIAVRDRTTFDSSATPKAGVRAVASPKAFAAVDLEALTAEIAATIEKAKADDPRELRKRIAQLERELAAKPAAAPPEVRIQTVVPESVKVAARDLRAAIGQALVVLNGVDERAGGLVRDLEVLPSGGIIRAGERVTIGGHDQPALLPQTAVRQVHTIRVDAPRARASAAPARRSGARSAEQRILDAAAWWRAAGIDAPTRHQVAFVAGYTVNGHFNNLVGGLRTKGLIDYPPGGGIVLTKTGAAAAAPASSVPTREALVEKVVAVLDPAPGRIFRAVADAGADMTREELAAKTGYTVNGHFNNMVGSLRSLGVIDYPQRGGVRLGQMFEALR